MGSSFILYFIFQDQQSQSLMPGSYTISCVTFTLPVSTYQIEKVPKNDFVISIKLFQNLVLEYQVFLQVRNYNVCSKYGMFLTSMAICCLLVPVMKYLLHILWFHKIGSVRSFLLIAANNIFLILLDKSFICGNTENKTIQMIPIYMAPTVKHNTHFFQQTILVITQTNLAVTMLTTQTE